MAKGVRESVESSQSKMLGAADVTAADWRAAVRDFRREIKAKEESARAGWQLARCDVEHATIRKLEQSAKIAARRRMKGESE